MRFTPDGPDVPPALIAAQERGETLFVCGAGVSRRTGLPGFHGLVEQIYKHLGESWRPYAAEREVMVSGGALHGQYDRMLRALERRLAGLEARNPQAMRDRIRGAVRAALTPAPDADTSDHACLLELSRDAEHRRRLLTTNFDALFERAWVRIYGGPAPSYACQAMPAPKAAGFEGVLHLHGRLADAEGGIGADSDLVLTSAEFGDAYLRSGWASRYLYDLARTHTLVLVGYGADDPPMRYLLEALEADRERFQDLRMVYAFASDTDEEGRPTLELWRAKGVEPVLYTPRAGDGHAVLYDTLREWCRYAADPTAWRRSQLAPLLAVEAGAADEGSVARVAQLLSHGDAGRLLADIAPPASWLPTLRARGVIAGGATTAGPWIARRVADAAMVQACATDPPDQDAWWHIDRALSEVGTAVPAGARRAWAWIRWATSHGIGQTRWAWYDLMSRARDEPFGHEHRAAVVNAFRPRLQVRTPIRWPGEPCGEADLEDPKSLLAVDFEPDPHGPAIQGVLDRWPRDSVAEERLLRALCRVLEEALEEALEAGFMDGFDRSSMDVPSVAEHPQNAHRRGFFPITRLAAAVWERLAERAPGRARAVADGWTGSEFVLVRRLHLHALSCGAVYPAATAAAFISGLDDESFWSGDLRREVMRLLADRWGEFAHEDRSVLAARIRAGMPASVLPPDKFPNVSEWRAVVDHAVFTRLSRLRSAAGPLDEESEAVIADVAARYPAWRPGPDDRDDFGSWITTSWGPQGNPDVLSGVPDGELVRRAAELGAERPLQQSDVWRMLCDADPERALRGLLAQAAGGSWEVAAWRDFLSAASAKPNPTLHAAAADALLRMPDEEIAKLQHMAASWLRERRDDIAPGSPDQVARFLAVWDRLAAITYATAAADKLEIRPEDEDVASAALNQSGGVLAWALCDAAAAPSPGEGAGLGGDLEPRFDRAASANGRAGLLARAYFVIQLPWLHRIAPDWAGRRLVPRLRLEHPEARALWRARLGGGLPRPALFRELKPALLALIRDEGMSRREAQTLTAAVLLPAIWARLRPHEGWDITAGEVREALATAVPDIRQQAVWHLWKWMAEEDVEPRSRAERWTSLVGPFFRDVWPLDVASRDGAVSRWLAKMALEAEEAVPAAVAEVGPLLTVFELTSASIILGLRDGRGDVATRHPQAVVDLLHAMVDPAVARAPYDLADVLARCASAEPAVVRTAAYQRLLGIARGLAA
jgi:hypothetical protein